MLGVLTLLNLILSSYDTFNFSNNTGVSALEVFSFLA